MSSKLDEIYPSTSNFIKVEDLKGQRVNVTIETAAIGEVGAEKKKQIVLTFKESPDKKLGLNKTNANMIAMLTGTDDYTNWIGIRITLKPDMTTYQGRVMPCIRIESELPQQAQGGAFAPPSQPAADVNKVPF